MAKPPVPLPVLKPTDYLEIERMAMQGLSLTQMAALFGMQAAQLASLARTDPLIADCVDRGRARGIRIVSKALLDLAATGKDVSACKFYLERIAGDAWLPPRAAPPTVVVYNSGPPVQIDQAAMARRFERQRALIDGTAEDLEVPS